MFIWKAKQPGTDNTILKKKRSLRTHTTQLFEDLL